MTSPSSLLAQIEADWAFRYAIREHPTHRCGHCSNNPWKMRSNLPCRNDPDDEWRIH